MLVVITSIKNEKQNKNETNNRQFYSIGVVSGNILDKHRLDFIARISIHVIFLMNAAIPKSFLDNDRYVWTAFGFADIKCDKYNRRNMIILLMTA